MEIMVYRSYASLSGTCPAANKCLPQGRSTGRNVPEHIYCLVSSRRIRRRAAGSRAGSYSFRRHRSH